MAVSSKQIALNKFKRDMENYEAVKDNPMFSNVPNPMDTIIENTQNQAGKNNSWDSQIAAERASDEMSVAATLEEQRKKNSSWMDSLFHKPAQKMTAPDNPELASAQKQLLEAQTKFSQYEDSGTGTKEEKAAARKALEEAQNRVKDLQFNEKYGEAQSRIANDQQLREESNKQISALPKEDKKRLEKYYAYTQSLKTGETLANTENAGTDADELIMKYGGKTVSNWLETMQRNMNQENAENLSQFGQKAAESAYGEMTDDEKKVYSRYQAQQQKLRNGETLTPEEVNDKDVQALVAKYGSKLITGELKNIGANTAAFGANLIGSSASGLDAAAQGIARGGAALSGTEWNDYQTIDPNAGNKFNAFASGVRQQSKNELTDKYGKGAGTVYDAVTSAIDSSLRLAVAGGSEALSLGMAGIGSFGSAVSEASDRGASPLQAILNGAFEGATEIATEKLPTENLLNAIKIGAGSPVELAVEILKNAGEEAVEEEVSLLASALSQAAILKGASEYNAMVGEAIANGATREEAIEQANQNLLNQAIETAISASLSGGMSTVGGALVGAAKGNGTQNTTQNDTQTETKAETQTETQNTQQEENTQNEVKEATEQNTPDTPRTMVQEAVDTLKSGGKVTSNQIDAILSDSESVAQLTEAGVDFGDTKSDARNAVRDFINQTATQNEVQEEDTRTDAEKAFDLMAQESPNAQQQEQEQTQQEKDVQAAFDLMFSENAQQETENSQNQEEAKQQEPETEQQTEPQQTESKNVAENTPIQPQQQQDNNATQEQQPQPSETQTALNLNPTETTDNKRVSQTGQTVANANVTPDDVAKLIGKKTGESKGKDGYQYFAITNDATVQAATQKIIRDGWENTRIAWERDVSAGVAGDQMSAIGALLYNNAVNAGDTRQALDILSSYMALERNTARGLQAASILKKLTPENRLYMISKSVNNLKESGKVPSDFQFSDSVIDEYSNAKSEKARDKAVAKMQQELADEMTVTFGDKFTALRYVNMLGNFKTQIRNVVGNTSMYGTVVVKQSIRAGIEQAVEKLSGGKYQAQTAVKIDKGLRDAALIDAANYEYALKNGGKYNESGDQSDFMQGVEDKKQIFKFQPLEKYRQVTNWAMDVGDTIFSSRMYARSLASYLSAHNMDAKTFRGILDGTIEATAQQQEMLDNARTYAVKEAQEATYHDDNAFSKMVQKIGKGNKVTELMGQAVLPFRKTPANVLARTVEYSPANFVNAAFQAAAIKKGADNVTYTDVMNNIAKATTGSVMIGLGYLLAKSGLITPAWGEDEAEDKQRQRIQGHSLKIGDTTLSLDWLAPVSMYVFSGVDLWNATQDDDFTGEDMMNVISQWSDDFIQMSFLSGIDSTLNDIKYTDNNMMNLAASIGLNYLTQGFSNTLLRQIESAVQPEKQTTYYDKESGVPRILQKSLSNVSTSIPGWDYNQVDKRDAWGRTIEGSGGDLLGRLAINMFSPANVQTQIVEAADKEIERLRELNIDVAPNTHSMSENISEYDSAGNVIGKHQITEDEYTQLSKIQGGTALELYNSIIDSSAYKSLPDTIKGEILSAANDYAREYAKSQVIENYPGVPSWMDELDSQNPESGLILHAMSGNLDKSFTALRKELGAGKTGYKVYSDFETLYDSAKKAGYLDELSESAGGAAKYYLQAREDGYSTKEFAQAYSQYYSASKMEDASNSEKALQFRDGLQKLVESGEISQKDADYWRREMKFFSMNAIGTGKYDEMTELGMSSTKAKITSQLISDFSSRYSDANGGKSPTNQAYYQEIAKQSNLTDDEKIQAMMSVTTNYNPNAESPNYSELKLQYMYNEFGLDPKVISEVWGALSENTNSKRKTRTALSGITDDSGNQLLSSQEVQQLYALYHPDAKWKQTLIDLYG